MADTFKIKKPRPLFRRGLRLAPAHPMDDRIMVRENPPESVSEGGVALSEKDQIRAMHGVLIAAGDAAADYLYDRGILLGDTIIYARYAGVREPWQHIVGDDDPRCDHSGDWDNVTNFSDTIKSLHAQGKKPGADVQAMWDESERKWATVGGPNINMTLRECSSCKTLIVTEDVVFMSCKDPLGSVEQQERIERGEVVRYRGKTPDGKTMHYLRRTTELPECYGPAEPDEPSWPVTTTTTLNHTNGKQKES